MKTIAFLALGLFFYGCNPQEQASPHNTAAVEVPASGKYTHQDVYTQLDSLHQWYESERYQDIPNVVDQLLDPTSVIAIHDSLKANLLLLKSKTLLKLCKPTEALASISTGVRFYQDSDSLSPDFWSQLLYCRGQLWNLQFQFDSALIDFRQSLATIQEQAGSWPNGMAQIYNQMGYTWRLKDDLKKAEVNLQLATQHLDSNAVNYLEAKLTNLIEFAAVHYWSQRYQKVSPYIERAIKLIEESDQSHQVHLGIALSIKGNVFNRTGQSEQEALAVQLKAVDLFKGVLGDDHLYIAEVYEDLVLTYYYLMEHPKIERFVKKAIDIKLNCLGPNHPALAFAYNRYGIYHYGLDDFQTALTWDLKALALLKPYLPESHDRYTYILDKIGLEYRYLKEYDKALYYLKKVIDLKQQKYGEYHPKLERAYSSYGNTLELVEKYDSSLYYQKKAQEIRIANLGPNNNWVALYYHHLGLTSELMQNYHQALHYYRKTLQTIGYQPDRPTDFAIVRSLEYLNRALNGMKESYWALMDQTNHYSYRDSLSHTLQLMVDLQEYYQYHYTGQDTRQYHAAKAIDTYEDAMRYILSMQADSSVAMAFLLSEQTKGRQLTEKIQFVQAEQNVRLPDSLYQREKKLNAEITLYEKKLAELLRKQDTSQQNNQTLQTIIFELRNQRDELIDYFKSAHPTYYHARYNAEVLGVEGVQQHLLHDSQDALIEYFVGDKHLYVFAVLKDTAITRQVPLDFPLQEWVQSLRCHLFHDYQMDPTNCGSFSGQNAQKHYREQAYALYQKLIAPIEMVLPQQGNIIIIPDGVLGYVPFEALITNLTMDSVDPPQPSYLLHNFTVSYAYSATLQHHMQKKQHEVQPEKNLIAFAPTYESRTSNKDSLLLVSRSIDASNPRNRLGKLEYNDDEVRSVAKQMNGLTFIGKKATKENFVKYANLYKMLHFATHGKANDQIGDHSFLAFQPSYEDSLDNELLYNNELYNLQLNADMVVLSACETGIGELKRGEGIISLARGFSFAGAKSIITTLWSIPDQTTKILMDSFYAYLKRGLPKNKALRQAKLDFINDLNHSNQSPLFWAGFIGIGDMRPIVLNIGNSSYERGLVTIAVVLLLTVLLIWQTLRVLR